MTSQPDFDALVSGRASLDGDAEASVTTVESAPSEPRPVEARGSRLDDRLGALLSTPARRMLWRFAGPVLVTLLAAVLRLWNLGRPSTLVFDETYYVKDAYTLMNLGYEGQWPDDADAGFAAGNVDTYTTAAEYVAHPPLGKWIIATGMQVLGADNPVGWRISTAIVGVIAVALVCLLAYHLFRSPTLATIAGGLLAVDGLAISMSRTALLDNSLMLLCLAGFGAVLLDRRQSVDRLASWLASRADAGKPTDWGPALFARPWLITAGALFGLATGVKWSGAYFLAVFAIYTLLVDAAARRRAGVHFWASSTAFRQAPATFLLMVPIAAVAYLSTWVGWFATAGGYNRQWAANQVAAGDAATADIVPFIPLALQSFWHYQVAIYNTNIALSTPHGYQANPLGWLAMLRPTAFFYEGFERGDSGCSFHTCAEYVTTVANPILWWLGVAAAAYLVFRLIRRREWQVGLILTGIAAGYLPWLLYTERTVFQFYTIVFLPYLVLGLTFVIGLVLGTNTDGRTRRTTGIRVVAVTLGLIALVSVFFYPSWTGMQVSGVFQQLHYWLPGWR